MYDTRPALTDPRELEQGDILRGILRPSAATAKNFALLKDGNKFKHPAPQEAVLEVSKDLRVVLAPQREELSVVVSSSCDNALGTLPILLVPAKPFKLQADTPEDQWLEISQAATGTANPKVFYLTASKEYGFERSQAQFNLMFSVSHDYIARCMEDAKTSRVCGLKPEAQRHLQWALSLFFGRNPREDYDWPSLEDLELKERWLEATLKAGGRLQERYEADLAEVRRRLGR